MTDPQTRSNQPAPADQVGAPQAAAAATDDASGADAPVASEAAEVAARPPAAAPAAAPVVAAGAAAPAAQPTAQVIDLDAVRAEERRATLSYVAEVHELCAIAGRGELAASFVAKATPVAQIRRALLEARAAEDEATAIRGQVRPAVTAPDQPAIDTAAIYAARNQHCR
jgi:hypothetical protein